MMDLNQTVSALNSLGIPELYQTRVLEIIKEQSVHPTYMGSLIDVCPLLIDSQQVTTDIDVQCLHEGNTFFSACQRVIGRRDISFNRKIVMGYPVAIQNPLCLKLKYLAEYYWAYLKLPVLSSSDLLLLQLKYEMLRDKHIMRLLDPVSRGHAHIWFSVQALTDMCLLRRTSLQEWAYPMRYLGSNDLQLYRSMADFLFAVDIVAREEILGVIVEHILHSIGGFPPKEWVLRRSIESVQMKSDSGEFVGCPLPSSIDSIHPIEHAYKIGINDWVASGQDLDLNGFEYSREYKPRFYWDDPSNILLPTIDSTVQKIVRHYHKSSHIMGILFFNQPVSGSMASDSSIELYFITSRRGAILEKRYIDGLPFHLNFVNVGDMYNSILRCVDNGYLLVFKDAKILFNRHPSVPLIQYFANQFFLNGLPPLPPNKISADKKMLLNALQGTAVGFEPEEEPLVLYNLNVVFCMAVKLWFQIKRLYKPRLISVMDEIKKGDREFYELVSDYILSHSIPSRQDTLIKIVYNLVSADTQTEPPMDT